MLKTIPICSHNDYVTCPVADLEMGLTTTAQLHRGVHPILYSIRNWKMPCVSHYPAVLVF